MRFCFSVVVFSSISLDLLPERAATLMVYEDVVEIVSGLQGKHCVWKIVLGTFNFVKNAVEVVTFIYLIILINVDLLRKIRALGTVAQEQLLIEIASYFRVYNEYYFPPRFCITPQ